MESVSRWDYSGLGEIEKIAKEMLDFGGDLRLWLFQGDLGAGKTTFIKALCKILEVEDVVNSPTFAIVNEYETLKGDPVYHFDLYRLKSEFEALDIGIEEYFDSGNYCFIEWPERAASLIPKPYVLVEITAFDEERRSLVATKHEEENRI